MTIETLQTLTAAEAAKRLLGADLIRTVDDQELTGRIVETEAYHENDPASHSHGGKTKRNQSMFLGGGHAYVYVSYGIHKCLNVVCGQEESGEGVLIRALEPIKGISKMQQLRSKDKLTALANGPGKLTQAMMITEKFDGHWLADPPLQLRFNQQLTDNNIISSKRIGISRNMDQKLRFCVKGSEYVSQN